MLLIILNGRWTHFSRLVIKTREINILSYFHVPIEIDKLKKYGLVRLRAFLKNLLDIYTNVETFNTYAYYRSNYWLHFL